jgi:N-acetylglutamate synthase/N-acetylornithine aminotransferase
VFIVPKNVLVMSNKDGWLCFANAAIQALVHLDGFAGACAGDKGPASTMMSEFCNAKTAQSGAHTAELLVLSLGFPSGQYQDSGVSCSW